MRAVRSRSLLALPLLAVGALALAACVDSAITGSADTIPPFDILTQDLLQDIAGDDTDAADTSRPDGVDAGCTANADCLAVLAPLGPCDDARCEPATGVCFAERRDGCCLADAECPQTGDPCLVPFCPAPGDTCAVRDACKPCQLDSDCQTDAPPCTQGRCSEGTCFFEPIETCCLSAADCGDADPCTIDRCDAGLCGYVDVGGPGCCTAPPAVATSFSPPPAGLVLRSTSPTITWSGLETSLTPSPPMALYLGDPTAYTLASADFGLILAEAGFPPVQIDAGAEIELKLQAYVDLPDPSALSVSLRYADGTVQPLWTASGAPASSWFPVKLTAPAASRGSAQLVLGYASLAVDDPQRFGALIDDLQLRTACGSATPCTSDAQCATADPCLIGRCLDSGECAFEARPGCCATVADCPPPTGPCVAPLCLDGRCLEEGLPGCCSVDLDCGASPDPCKLRPRCANATCVLVDAPVDCDDADPCTADRCAGGACFHDPIPGCCVGPDCACTPDLATFTFEDASEGWTFDAPAGGYGWRRVEIQTAGLPRVLYFGNPDAGPALDPGFPLTARATSPPIALPATASSVTVRFQAFVGVDLGQPTDAVRLEALTASGQTVVLWQLSTATPRYEVVDLASTALSAVAGQVVTLRFVYAATDSFAADGFGLLFDDVTLTAVCSGPQCTTPATCPSGDACAVRTCDAGLCGLAPRDCDDADPCTDDLCDAMTGECVHAPSGFPGCGGCEDDLDCDDGDPCTFDLCAGGECLNLPDETLPGCGGGCQSPSDCDDQDPCTANVCRPDGVCANPFNPNLPGCTACTNAAQCNDGDPCTRDRCLQNQCQNTPDSTLPGCAPPCDSAADCDDQDPCTANICRPNGTCGNPFNPGLPGCEACTNAAQCNDQDACTLDRCVQNRCEHTPDPTLPGCGGCQTDAQCADTNACTRDRCVAGVCQNTPDSTLPGCGGCQTDAQCADTNACTRDRCVAGTCQNTTDPTLPGCGGCQSDTQCADTNACTRDRCVAGVCQNTPDSTLPGCGCQTDAQCPDNDACTRDRCVAGACQHTPDPTLPGCALPCAGPADCNDGLVCTQDLCATDGRCAHPVIPGCCTSSAACSDGDVCTNDLCDLATGACSHTPVNTPACTVGCVPADCNDQNVCTADSCNSFTKTCNHQPIADCCTAQSQCADGDVCTLDQCTNNRCTHSLLPLPGCGPDCTTDAECEDGNACTTNRCGANGTCQTSVIFGCCDSASDCADGNACTTDTCLTLAGVCFNGAQSCNDNNACTLDSCDPATGCVFTPDPDCCANAAQCDDGDPCTIDGCAAGRCVHAEDTTCCGSDADCVLPHCAQGTCAPNGECLYATCCETGATGVLCDDGNACTQDSCAAGGVCKHTPTAGCCNADSDCPAAADCQIYTCNTAQHTCVAAEDPTCCQEQTVASYGFNTSSLAGWTLQPAQAPNTVTWWISNRHAVSSPSSLYMGNPVTGTYDNGGVPKAYATSPPIALPANAVGLEATFKVWLDVETFADFDPFFVDVVRQNGSTTTVWNKTAVPTNQYRTWVSSRINLTAFAGQTIRLRLRFEADDQLLNQTEGIFVDDLVVRVTCSPVTSCNADSECNDGDACTSDRCAGNLCQATAIAGCCQSAADCNDAYACTTDTCVNNKCLNSLIPNCCVFDGECDDGKGCTTDTCNAATRTCVFVDTGGCCQSALDCADGDACTSDVCQGDGTCFHGPATGTPGCCVPGTFLSDPFPSQVLTGFTVSGDGSAVRWRVFNGQFASPPFAMYYGNPATRNYDTGARTYGTATSGDVVVPASAFAPQLTFNVWLDLGSFFFDDLLSVRVLTTGDAFTVWERTQLPFGSQQEWIPVTVSLPETVIGRTIRVQFAFDSIDEQGNDGEGIYIDDVVVSSTCP